MGLRAKDEEAYLHAWNVVGHILGIERSLMVETMDERFGSCTNHGECEAACPKEISIDVIALMNKDYRKAKFANRKDLARK